jgi:hypothetical protein
MFTKDELKQAIAEEIRLARHLSSKLSDVDESYTPSPNMRTLRDLLGYLSVCALAPADALVKDDWSVVPTWQARAKGVGKQGFDAAMARQGEEVAALIDAIPDKDYASRQVRLPWGESVRLDKGLYLCSVRFLVAYRMQLFLYLKQAGHDELGTANAWRGMDAAPPKGGKGAQGAAGRTT